LGAPDAGRLSNIFTTLFLATVYGAATPLLLPLSALVFFLTYWRDKYYLLHAAAVPHLIKARLSAHASGWFAIMVAVHVFVATWAVSNNDFLYPAYILDFDVDQSFSSSTEALHRLTSKHAVLLVALGLLLLCMMCLMACIRAVQMLLPPKLASTADAERIVMRRAVVEKAMGSQCWAACQSLGRFFRALCTPKPKPAEYPDDDVLTATETDVVIPVVLPDFDGKRCLHTIALPWQWFCGSLVRSVPLAVLLQTLAHLRSW
jgi:hypothetical protein